MRVCVCACVCACVYVALRLAGSAPADLPSAALAWQTNADVAASDGIAANVVAKLAVRALARLGGYLDGDAASPKNPVVQRAICALLTPILARRLCRATPEALLKSLNGHEQCVGAV